jgi:thiol-disulfide isomerase/thioredoxin
VAFIFAESLMGDNMKRRFIFVFFVLLLCGFSVLAAENNQAVPSAVARAFAEAGLSVLPKKVPVVDFTVPLADFTAPLTGARTQNLKALKGKVVFLNFWATWCGPCRQEMPSMEILYQRFKNQGFEILAMNYQEGQKDVAAFMKNYKLSFPAGLDSSGQVGRSYGIEAFPTTYIIDREGYIIARIVGSLNWNTPKMLAAFETLLNTSQ